MNSNLLVRPMELSEVDIIIDYFLSSTPEQLEKLGVDPTRLRTRESWRRFFKEDYARAIGQREGYGLLWLSDESPVGFSTADTIRYGTDAKIHLHILGVDDRNCGLGTECVRQSVRHYLDIFELERIFCEPNAFNIPPNRSLQSAGFRYVKTHKTVPGRINFHQTVTRWVIERGHAG